MTFDRSADRALTALGFFMQGIPAIFVRTEILLGADPQVSDYIRSVVENAPLDFSQEQVLRGCELFQTPLHELRHFHDALLCRPLLRLFQRQNLRHIMILQLPRVLSGVTADNIPFQTRADIPSQLNPVATAMIMQMQDNEEHYAREYRTLFNVRTCLNDIEVSLIDLLEETRWPAELMHVAIVHGAEAASQYYEGVVRNLPSEYNRLLNAFLFIGGDLQKAVEALHLAATYSLYGSDDPAMLFSILASEYAADSNAFVRKYNPLTIEQLFSNEAALEAEVERAFHRISIETSPEYLARGCPDSC